MSRHPHPWDPATADHRWAIRDASGALWAEHLRWDLPAGKCLHWYREGRWSLEGIPARTLPLYGVHELDERVTVVLTEGERACDAVVAAGVSAVATVTGASTTPDPAVFAELTGKIVVLSPDADPEGRAHMDRNGAQLVDVAAEVRILVPPPGVPQGWDLADADTDTIHRLVETAAPWSGDPEPVLPPTAWETPLALDPSADLPRFPLEALPGWLADFVAAEAEATQTPPDLAGTFALGMASAAAGGRASIEPSPGWSEQTNVFLAVAMAPGTRKSAVLRDLSAPIVERERELAENAGPEITAAASKRRIAESRLSRIEKSAASETDPDARASLTAEAAALAGEISRLRVPPAPRLFTNDATPEAIGSLLSEQGGVLSILSAEGGGIFEIIAGRYGDGRPNLEVFLAGHAGDTLRVDRKGRPTEFVGRPALSMVLAVQPAVLARAGRNPDFAGRGLLDRFLYAVPRNLVGHRRVDPEPVPDAVRSRYHATIRRLAADLATDPQSSIPFTPSALETLRDWLRTLEPRRAADGDLGHVAGWASKLDGAVIRLAGLLHIATQVEEAGYRQPIGRGTVAAAIILGEYFLVHALAAFAAMGADDRLADARAIVAWARRERLRTLTRRDAHRAHQARFPKADDLDSVLTLLVDRGWIARLTDPSRGPGRPTSPRYAVNPLVVDPPLTKLTQTTEPDATAPSVSSVTGGDDDVAADPADPLSAIRELLDAGALAAIGPLRLSGGVLVADPEQAARTWLRETEAPAHAGRTAREHLTRLHSALALEGVL